MSGLLRAIVTVAPAALFALPIAGAQVPGPTLRSLISPGDSVSEAPDACRAASRVAALDVHERVAVLCPDSLDLTAIHDLTDLLSSRIPGVLIQEVSGTPGTAARVRIRGSGSIELDNAPLVIVDGVRFLGRPVRAALLVSEMPSRLDDIDLHGIALIEVLRGPATTAIYGTGAANGVIRITTKRGGSGGTRWKAFATSGVAVEPTSYPAIYAQPGIATSNGESTNNCSLDDRATSTCTAGPEPLASWNPLEQVSQFRTGLRQDYGVNVTGGGRVLGYHAGVGHSSADGVLEGSDVGRTHMRLNLDAKPLRQLTIGLTSAYLMGDTHFPKTGLHILSVLYSGLLGNPVDDPVYRGYLIHPDSLNTGSARQETNRLGAGAWVSWTPLSWLSLDGGLGVDDIGTDDLERTPNDFSEFTETRTTATLDIRGRTAGASATASFSLGDGVRIRSRVGYERLYSDVEWRSRRDQGGGGVATSTYESEQNTAGIYLQQHLAWRDRFAVDGSLRRDEFLSGSGSRPEPLSGSLAVSWMARLASSDAEAIMDGPIRVHLAYGRVAGVPTQYDPPFAIGGLPGQLPRYQSPEDGGGADPEQTSEIEAGLVSSLLRDRLRISFSAYRQSTTNVFLPLIGGQYVLDGIGIENTGLEATLSAAVYENRTLRLSTDIGLWSNSNEVVSLPQGPLSLEPRQWISEGYALGGFWGRRVISYNDRNDDGIISRVNCPGQPAVSGGPECEIEVGTGDEYLGSATPRFEMFLAPKAILAERIEISALVDYRSGFKQLNRTEGSRCAYQRCRAYSDAEASLADQARVIGSIMDPNGYSGLGGAYIEDATFVKLRELAVSLSVPQAWTNAIGGRSARLTLAGRNLATWTGYSGLDPEINASGPLGIGQTEFYTQPPLRHYTARLSVGW